MYMLLKSIILIINLFNRKSLDSNRHEKKSLLCSTPPIKIWVVDKPTHMSFAQTGEKRLAAQ